MKHGLEGRLLEKFVADMHLKHRVPRCPEAPPLKRGEQALLPLERVRENGLRLAGLTGARADVVELFAYFHDACRHNDSHDPEHGARGADLARGLVGSVFDLDPEGLFLLTEACTGHTHGQTVAEITVATCWDADRLDLPRVGMTPRPERLCTDAARAPEIIAWACSRSRGR